MGMEEPCQEVSQCPACMLDTGLMAVGCLGSRPDSWGPLVWGGRVDVMYRLILNLTPGSLVTLLEIQKKF